mmetsp:Transcript_20154/g.30303  ORF Transcript_20154/g.30303 Transcript_20154/m.30303 type:complete len:352 (+) Transcript_20154:107-1162(+)
MIRIRGNDSLEGLSLFRRKLGGIIMILFLIFFYVRSQLGYLSSFEIRHSFFNDNTNVEIDHQSGMKSRKILVGYSGPTSLDRSLGKNELYLRNFEFFLQHGVDCRYFDTAIGLTEEVAKFYESQLMEIQQDCNRFGNNIYTVLRVDNKCHDLDTVYTLFYNSSVVIRSYDYFVYVNCGMTGPSPQFSSLPLSWVTRFLDPLSDTVKMSGLSINCFRKNSPHVQSMAYAFDRVGLQIILEKSNAVFDCRQELKDSNQFNKIVSLYEKGMSKAILDEGYGLASIVWPGIVFWKNRTNCTLIDRWGEANLKLSFGGRLPFLNETIFFKTSRLLPLEMAELINFPGLKASWHAER